LARRQRRRRRLSGRLAGDVGERRAKLPFPVNLIWNSKTLYIGFIMLMIGGLGAVGLAPGLGSTGGSTPAEIVDEEELPDVVETPEGLLTFGAPEKTIDVAQGYEAVVRTCSSPSASGKCKQADQGEIVIALNRDAPKAAESFAFLASQNFYDELEFFWVYRDDSGRGFDAQAGDPTCEASGELPCTGRGGPGYTLAREGDSTEAGQWAVIAPVTSPGGDQVHGSQFVIALTDDGKFEGSVIGHVIEGQEILESLERRTPCFGSEPSESNPCQTDEELPAALTILDIVVQPA